MSANVICRPCCSRRKSDGASSSRRAPLLRQPPRDNPRHPAIGRGVFLFPGRNGLIRTNRFFGKFIRRPDTSWGCALAAVPRPRRAEAPLIGSISTPGKKAVAGRRGSLTRTSAHRRLEIANRRRVERRQTTTGRVEYTVPFGGLNGRVVHNRPTGKLPPVH